jgi:hypothetical protein
MKPSRHSSQFKDNLTTLYHYADCHNAACHVLFVHTLNVFMLADLLLSVMAP